LEAVLGENRIMTWVPLLDKAETAKEGSSILPAPAAVAPPFAAWAWRLTKLARLLNAKA